MRKKLRFKGVFSRLSLMIIFFVLVVTLLNSIASSLVSSSVIRSEAYKANRTFLNKLSKLVENKTDDINKILAGFSSRELATQDKLRGLSGDYYSRYTFQKAIDQQLTGVISFFDSAFLYIDEGKKVLVYSPGNSIFRVSEGRDFFDTPYYHGFLEKNVSAEIIGIRTITPNYFYSQSSNTKKARVFSYFMKIPYGYSQTGDVMVVNINEKALLGLMEDHYIPDRSILYLYDRGGDLDLFYRSGGDYESGIEKAFAGSIAEVKGGIQDGEAFTATINGEKYYYTALVSGREWTYLLALPEKEMYKPITSVNTFILVVCIVIIIFGIIFSKLMDKKFFHPVIGILGLLKSNKGHSEANIEMPQKQKIKNNEFTQIKDYIEELISNNAEQKKQLESHFSFYRERLLHSLLNNEYELIGLIEEDRVLFKSEYAYFCVVLLSGIPAEERNGGADHSAVFREGVKNLAETLHDFGQVDIVCLSPNRHAIILGMENSMDTVLIEEKLKKTLDRINGENLWMRMGIGNIYDSILDVHKSLSEAEMRQQATAGNSGGNEAKDMDEFRPDSKAYTYPEKLEELIIKDMYANRSDLVREDIKEFGSYIKESCGNIRRARKYFMILVYNIARKLDSHNREEGAANLLNTTFDEIEMLGTVKELEDWLQELIEKSMGQISNITDNYNKELIEKVTNYINSHYMENIGLNIIADYVYLSPSYLGRIFKEISGGTFTDYLIKVRMETAADMIVNKKVKITDVVGKVGYQSIQSFSRVFKNYFNCSPSEYRRKHASENTKLN